MLHPLLPSMSISYDAESRCDYLSFHTTFRFSGFLSGCQVRNKSCRAKAFVTHSCLAQALTPFWPYQKSTESISQQKDPKQQQSSKKHPDLTGLHHVEIASMKHVYVKTSVRKVKTPGISSSSTVLKAFSPDFQAWTALEVLPQPRAFKERAVLGT